MKAVVQRVLESSVNVNDKTIGAIGRGMLVLFGITHSDTSIDVDYLTRKIAGLRMFNDVHGKMNLSLDDIGGSILVVSQFTLYGDTRKGMRPSYDRAARPEIAEPLYRQFLDNLRSIGIRVESGVFGANMQVSLVNDGPVTLILNSDRID